ncbi:MAG: site-specific DNA-methyltransferase [candidate division Zixibacteria bacterium]
MKNRAPRNRTLDCTKAEIKHFSKSFLQVSAPVSVKSITDTILHQDFTEARAYLPDSFVDLLVMDPPYNLTKNYNGHMFKSKQAEEYVSWFADIVSSLRRFLRPNASIYVCSDWKTSNLIFPVLNQHFQVRNRITWEREKGRGAKSNWKNNTEDIWFCTCSDDYYFNVNAVKLKRRVIAPYRLENGAPKDWEESQNGNYRLTYPSNIWSDITIPFWSMPENTDHPTQKPEKLIAKLILASSRPEDFILDPFLGSGTTAVVARKLSRRFCGIELNHEYCCWAAKRLKLAEKDPSIQGYSDGMFWERNSLNDQKSEKPSRN